MRKLIRPDASFTPRELFARMQGAWFEPRQGSMWQERAGASKVTVAGQSVGMVTDLSSFALSPELLSNGDFSGGTAGWSVVGSATLSAANGVLSITAQSDGNNGAKQLITGLSAGDLYYIEAKIKGTGSSTALPTVRYANGNTTSGVIVLLGVGTEYTNWVIGTNVFRPTGTSVTIVLLNSGDGSVATFEYDYVSVKKLTNNAASQATAANRPIYQLDAKSLPYLAHDSTDSLSVALPNLSGGVFSSSGSVYFGTPQGMSALHNQSIGTTYTLPAVNTDIYGWLVLPMRLTQTKETQLQRYFERLAGLR